jgi:hypothetical protein
MAPKKTPKNKKKKKIALKDLETKKDPKGGPTSVKTQCATGEH